MGAKGIAVGASFLLAAALGHAQAQTIRHEVDGRAHTYEFKQSTSDGRRTPTKAQASGKGRAITAELPRGPKNLPWDEPGKISGLPGVQENERTSLPIRSKRRGHGEPRAASIIERVDVPVRKRAGTESGSLLSPLEGADAPPIRRLPRNVAEDPVQTQGQTLAPRQEGALDDGRTKARADEAEARAKMIAEARDRALAQEQKRLDLERRRDRARPSEPLSASLPSHQSTPQPQQEPASTGSIATGRTGHAAAAIGGDQSGAQTQADRTALNPAATPPALPGTPTWKDGVCRLLFFGAVKGC